ncbi:ImmA/IrrE family metallo-endopeptidase [Clavibacter sp. Sh2126]|uniref:ImmA/IrrE family metallo-endopeptidase n=1 Tax=Clavibacter sp. Sh2126 TaxID=3397678 RepID=UPI0039E04C01
MVTDVPVRPEVLRWALDRSGMEAGSDRHTRFSAWASGHGVPTLSELDEFARATHVPFGYLFLPEPPRESLPIPDLRTVRDRGVSRPSPDLLDVIDLARRAQDWYREHSVTRGEPPLDFVGSAPTTLEPVAVASAIRVRLDYAERIRDGSKDMDDAVRVAIESIEETGVLVMISGIVGANTHRKLDVHEFRGFALSDPRASVIFVNGVDARPAQLFTLMHELAHVWAGQSALSDADPTASEAHPTERWANAVAAEVLLPVAELAAALGGDVSLEPERIRRLARRFHVSPLVVLHRLFDAGLMPWEAYRSAYVTEEERGRIMADEEHGSSSDGGNYYNTRLRQVGRRFARDVIVDALEGRTLYRDAFRLLGTRKHATFEGLATRLGIG